jgi:two-component system, oxyanion-binding sensor
MSETKLRVGYIPLVDAAALVVAADCGFAAAEGLDIELVREVSWSNVRDKLNIGQFDAAHLLSPMAIASSLGIGHVRIPVIAPFNLGLNGNAITVSPKLHAAMAKLADGDLADPSVSAQALMRVVEARKAGGAEPLTFGMTFPFSNHNYQLRFWMAAGGVDPDEDVRLVVLPPPYMVESLASGHVDGFCVGAPWNSVAVEAGLGRILHFSSEIMAQASEKVLAVRTQCAADRPEILNRLIRALARATDFVADAGNRNLVSATVAKRIEVDPDLVARTLVGHLRIAPDGTTRTDPRYIRIGGEVANRPDSVQAAWLYAQMARWGQAPLTPELYGIARNVFRPDLYDAALGVVPSSHHGGPADGIGAFTGPDFVADDIAGHLSAWRIKRAGKPKLSVVR